MWVATVSDGVGGTLQVSVHDPSDDLSLQQRTAEVMEMYVQKEIDARRLPWMIQRMHFDPDGRTLLLRSM